MDTETFTIVVGLKDEPVRRYAPDKGTGFEYLFNPPGAPGFLKMYYGKKTVFIPIDQIIFFELEL